MTGCQICSSQSICTNCLTGYVLQNNKCVSCTITNCISCLTLKVCTLCSQNYLLQSGSCNLCSSIIQNCKICSLATQCTICLDSYVLSPLDNGNIGCVPYTNVEKCKDNQNSQCSAC
jgi:hypothetical protein